MFNFEPFDMDLDGDVDGIDFLGFDCLMRHLLGDGRDDDEDTAEGNNIRDDEIPRQV